MRIWLQALPVFLLGLTPPAALAQTVVMPAQAAHRCGLVVPVSGDPFPPPDYAAVTDDPAFAGGAFVESVIFPARTFADFAGSIDWTCQASADPVGPVASSTVESVGVNHPFGASVSAGVNISMQLVVNPLPGTTGGPRMVPVQIDMMGSVFVDPGSHTLTTASTTITAPLRLTMPFTNVELNYVGDDPTDPANRFTFIQRSDAIGPGCCKRTGGVVTPVQVCGLPPATCASFNDIVEGEVEEGVVHQYQMASSAAAARPLGSPGDSGNAFADAMIDPIFRIDPDAEFAPGQRYADFYAISVSENVQTPEPAAAVQGGLALVTLGLLLRRKPRSTDGPGGRSRGRRAARRGARRTGPAGPARSPARPSRAAASP